MNGETMIKLNIGCGSRPLEGFINVDQDDLKTLRRRYPNQVFSDTLIIKNYNIFELPFGEGTVDNLNADGLLEHLSFKDEPRFLYEVHRVLKQGGTFDFSVPDFEKTCIAWLKAEDDWKDFFSDCPEAIQKNHWFGTNSYGYENRWGYITATFYGSQNGKGQFHQNCYSKGKIRKMLAKVGFEVLKIEQFRWKTDRDFMLQVNSKKK